MTAQAVVGDCREILAALPADTFSALVTDPPYELGFMGKSWDASGVAFDPATWRACLRVMRPGAYGVAFGGTRTYHRIACAIEDAGFEIRDCLSWLYGTGFPKSLNGPWGGTALKPAWEPIILFRKPLAGTVAATFAAHGTGGLGIEATRIGTTDPLGGGAYSGGTRAPVSGDDRSSAAAGMYGEGGRLAPEAFTQPIGRWPANVCLDEEAAAALDVQSGVTRSSAAVRNNGAFKSVAKGADQAHESFGHADSGGASRFFYVAKASAAERERGCEHLPKRSAGELTDRQEGSDGLSSPRAGAGRSSAGRANHHPTVKPIALMRWLVRLLCPVGGAVFDPFLGSGTTGVAAVAEGRDFLGIDLDPEYVTIARARMAAAPQAEAPCG